MVLQKEAKAGKGKAALGAVVGAAPGAAVGRREQRQTAKV